MNIFIRTFTRRGVVIEGHPEMDLVENEGPILRKPKESISFDSIATGEYYTAPQILEMKLK